MGFCAIFSNIAKNNGLEISNRLSLYRDVIPKDPGVE